MLNGTNYTVEISKLIIENVSNPSNNTSLISYIGTLIPIATILLSAYTIYSTKKNLETQLKYQERNLFIQINQQEIVNSTKKLIEKVETGDRENIIDFLESGEALFIPLEIKQKIRDYLKKETVEILDSSKVQKIMDMIHIY